MFTPWKYLPAGFAHDVAPYGLSFYADLFGDDSELINTWLPFDWRGLQFINPIGIAGGVDKNAELIPVWQKLGAGFIEIGTVTPRAQQPNPGKIIDRDWDHQALWNRMGFPSLGASDVLYNITNNPCQRPLFINVGKNRDTSNEDANQDYIQCIEKLSAVADAFVINVSSPNTKGLRDLQNKKTMENLVTALRNRTDKPLLVKLSPDMNSDQLSDVLEGCISGGAAGFILTNTTLSRSADLHFPKEGGVSGKPVQNLSIENLRKVITYLGPQKKDFLLVSAGGIITPQDALERLKIGANLVQTYSGLVFGGPGFFQNVRNFVQERK